MSKKSYANLPDELVIAVTEVFLDPNRAQDRRYAADETARIVNERWRAAGIDFEITREDVYPIVRESRRRGHLIFRPPVETSLSRQIAARFGVSDPSRLRVVASRSGVDLVATATAVLAVERIQELHRRGREKVHVGLGAGWTTMHVARQLALQLVGVSDLPRLCFHALSSSFYIDQPQVAPVAFFGFFDKIGVETEYVGLSSTPMVRSEAEYAELKKLAGLREAFAAAGDIDIVLTSLAPASDPHGSLNRFLDDGARSSHASSLAVRKLKRAGWIGDLLYRPFGRNGPITNDVGLRAVTLFELEDLATLASADDKFVIVTSGPCGHCGQTRSAALRPVLEQERLKVWTDVVTDLPTASELMH